MKHQQRSTARRSYRSLLAAIVLLAAGAASASGAGLADSLTFHASFDRGADADFGQGDRRIFMAPSLKEPQLGAPGLSSSGAVTIAKGEGKAGGALRFHRKTDEVVYFLADNNVAYAPSNWNGTVSFWLRLDPDADLAPGYCDPLQITPRQWNDAALWVDFSKDERPRHFRLGAFADRKVWDPTLRDLDKTPPAERPMVTVTRPPFSRERWTHVAFTFANFNTAKSDGVATLYLDGKPQGTISARQQTYTWDPATTRVLIGISYTGLFDELALFSRALSAAEVAELYASTKGIGGLYR